VTALKKVLRVLVAMIAAGCGPGAQAASDKDQTGGAKVIDMGS
jgi:hypothetical protein